MILATYQVLDYLNHTNTRFSKLKDLLGISQNKSLFWCISANNIHQIIINTYTIVANQPSLFIMFETNDFYKVDAIKWNHYVETEDENLLTEDLFNIEHEDAIEYIVTNIPEKRFEVNTTPYELSQLLTNKSGKYYKSALKYGSVLLQGFNNYPNKNEIENIPIKTIEKNTDNKLILLQKYFIAFKSFFLIPLYFIGLDYLGYKIDTTSKFRILNLKETYEIVSRHALIYINYETQENLYKRYLEFYNYIYEKIFEINKIYPNDICLCGSGLKYKKCCMKNNKILYRKMIEVL